MFATDFTLPPDYQALERFATDVAAEYRQRPPMNFRERVRFLGETGLLKHLFPREYRGVLDKPFDALSLCVVRQALGREAPELDTTFTMQGLGGYPILLAGSEALRSQYVPDLVTGQQVAALALTEAEAGSDLGNIQTTARRRGSFYVIDGSKKLITNAGEADFYVVAARTTEQPRGKGLSALVVEAHRDGLDVVSRQIMSPHPNGDLTFRECRVPVANRLGNEGDGYSIVVDNLIIFRPSVGAFAVGLAQRALRFVTQHVGRRVQFGRKLAQMEVIQFKIADMVTRLSAASLLVYQAACKLDADGVAEAVLESSMAKLFATEASFAVINEAVQIFGGDGVTLNHPVERLYREVRPLLIYEGTSEIQRLIIAREWLRRQVPSQVA